MNTSGEAAEQVMRMSLEGAEILIKLTGSGAKNAAVLLYSIYKEQNKTRGKERLTNMLRSGKPLKVYTFKRDNLEKFKEVAKEYGILYTVLKEKEDKDGVFDVLVRADDDSKLARVIERFKFSGVDTAEVRTSMQKERAEKGEAARTAPVKEEESKESAEEPEKEKEATEPEQAEPTVTAQVGDDEEKETPERTAPTKEQNCITARLKETDSDLWNAPRVRYILTNEKYIGDALLQKTFTPAQLPLRNRPNRGELDMYYAEGTHEAIISKEVFEKVKQLLEERGETHGHKNRDPITYRIWVWSKNSEHRSYHKSDHTNQENDHNHNPTACGNCRYNSLDCHYRSFHGGNNGFCRKLCKLYGGFRRCFCRLRRPLPGCWKCAPLSVLRAATSAGKPHKPSWNG